MPPGPSSREMTAQRLDARTGQGVGDLEATGPAPDDDDVVVAGREDTIRYSDHVLAARSRLASIWSMRYATLGRLSISGFKLVRRDDEAPQHGRRDHVGRRRGVGQNRDLAEEVAPRQAGPLIAVDHDSRLAVQDHVEAAARHVLAEHALILCEHILLERVRQGVELRVAQIAEQAQARQGLDDVLRRRFHAGGVYRGPLSGRLASIVSGHAERWAGTRISRAGCRRETAFAAPACRTPSASLLTGGGGLLMVCRLARAG